MMGACIDPLSKKKDLISGTYLDDINYHTQLFKSDDGSDNKVLQEKLAERRKPFYDGKEKIVTEEELPKWQAMGYKTKNISPSGKYIIDMPS